MISPSWLFIDAAITAPNSRRIIPDCWGKIKWKLKIESWKLAERIFYREDNEEREAAKPQAKKDFNARVAKDARDANVGANKRNAGHKNAQEAQKEKTKLFNRKWTRINTN